MTWRTASIRCDWSSKAKPFGDAAGTDVTINDLTVFRYKRKWPGLIPLTGSGVRRRLKGVERKAYKYCGGAAGAWYSF